MLSERAAQTFNVGYDIFNRQKTNLNSTDIVVGYNSAKKNFAVAAEETTHYLQYDPAYKDLRVLPTRSEALKYAGELKQEYDQIRCVLIRPYMSAQEHIMPNTLRAFQQAVDGYIECALFKEDINIICNEEYLYREQCFANREINGTVFCGNILLVKANALSGEFVSMTDEEIELYTDMFSQPQWITRLSEWEFASIPEYICVSGENVWSARNETELKKRDWSGWTVYRRELNEQENGCVWKNISSGETHREVAGIDANTDTGYEEREQMIFDELMEL